MKAAYQIADRTDRHGRAASDHRILDRKDSRALAWFLSGEGQALLPMLELIEQAEMAETVGHSQVHDQPKVHRSF